MDSRTGKNDSVRSLAGERLEDWDLTGLQKTFMGGLIEAGVQCEDLCMHINTHPRASTMKQDDQPSSQNDSAS